MKTKPILLYVEDDKDILENTTFLLEDYFSEIYTAVDGQEALAKYKEHKPDIALLDINIPKINGIELAKIIRKDSKDIPILFLTAYCDKDKLLKAIDIGTSSYIVKPFKIDELQTAITKAISKKGFSKKINLACGFSWDKDVNIVSYKSQELKLTKKELQLITVLDNNREKFFSACELSVEVFNENQKDVKCNNIVQLISRLKNKITQHFQTEDFFIKNIYGMGYKITS